MENVLPEQPAEKNVVGYTSAPPPGAGGPLPEPGVARLRLAGWWRRVGATLIDGLMIGALAAILLAALIAGAEREPRRRCRLVHRRRSWRCSCARSCAFVAAVLYAP